MTQEELEVLIADPGKSHYIPTPDQLQHVFLTSEDQDVSDWSVFFGQSNCYSCVILP